MFLIIGEGFTPPAAVELLVRNSAPAHSLRTLSRAQRVEVTEPPVVPRARWLGWSREAATTALVARQDVTPFGRLRLFPPSRARCYFLVSGGA